MINRYLLRNTLIINVFTSLIWLGNGSVDINVLILKSVSFVFCVYSIYAYGLTLKDTKNKATQKFYQFITSDIQFRDFIYKAIISYLNKLPMIILALVIVHYYFDEGTINLYYFLYIFIVNFWPTYFICFFIKIINKGLL